MCVRRYPTSLNVPSHGQLGIKCVCRTFTMPPKSGATRPSSSYAARNSGTGAAPALPPRSITTSARVWTCPPDVQGARRVCVLCVVCCGGNRFLERGTCVTTQHVFVQAWFDTAGAAILRSIDGGVPLDPARLAKAAGSVAVGGSGRWGCAH